MAVRLTLAEASARAVDSILRTAGGYCALPHPTRHGRTCDGRPGHQDHKDPAIAQHECWSHRGEPWTDSEYAHRP